MERNVKCLKDFLTNQGYTPEEIEKYLKEKGEEQRNTMQRAVVGLFFKNSDFKIMPKAFNQWKRWIENRRLYKRQAAFVVNALRHPLFWSFRKWRNQEEIARNKLKDITKKQLIDKIIQDELAIGSAVSRLGRMDEAID